MDEREGQQQAARIEALMQEVVAFPEPRARAKMEELLHALLEMYGAGLQRMIEMTAQAESAGQALLQTFAGDELIGSLLLLHGLHPVGLEERVRLAIEKLRSSTQARGGTIELVRVEHGAAFLRLAGNRQGCAASTQAFKQTVENAIYNAVPDLDELHIEEAAEAKRVGIPVKFIPPRRAQQSSATKAHTHPSPASDKSQASISRMRWEDASID